MAQIRSIESPFSKMARDSGRSLVPLHVGQATMAFIGRVEKAVASPSRSWSAGGAELAFKLPSPLHSWQAPYGLLKLKIRGSISS